MNLLTNFGTWMIGEKYSREGVSKTKVAVKEDQKASLLV